MAGQKNEKKNWKEPTGFNGARAELRWVVENFLLKF
jgi:hypothetical protein